MSLHQFRWPLLCLIFLALTACVSTPRPERVVIVSPVTTPGCDVTKLYRVKHSTVRCHVIEGRWYYQTWIPQHKVCTYRSGKIAFVDGYWKCVKHSVKTGRCVAGKWISIDHPDQVIVY